MMLHKKRKFIYFIIAFILTAGVVAQQQSQKLSVTVANTIICSIPQPAFLSHTYLTLESFPMVHCNTNSGNRFTIIREIINDAIVDTVLPIP